MPEKFTLTPEERLIMYERIMDDPQTEDFYNLSRHGYRVTKGVNPPRKSTLTA